MIIELDLTDEEVVELRKRVQCGTELKSIAVRLELKIANAILDATEPYNANKEKDTV